MGRVGGGAAVSMVIAWLASGCGTEPATLGDSTALPNDTATSQVDAATQAFVGFLDIHGRATDPAVRDLYYAYYDRDTEVPWFISTMISAEAVRFFLRLNRPADAARTAQALLAWQHDGAGDLGERLAGAFPSEVTQTNSGAYVANYLYDSGDNLAVMDALLEMYETTGDAQYLEAAHTTGRWLRDVMSHGERYSVWSEPHHVPMKAVTDQGAFDNRIAVGRLLFWLPVLTRLAAHTGDISFADLANTSYAFLAQGQTASGAYYDHYDPGYPAQAFNVANFHAYADPNLVVADDSLRAALGIAQNDAYAANLFWNWLAHDVPGISGYLDLRTGQAPAADIATPSYDVISTMLLQQLATKLGQAAPDANAFLQAAQHANGGFAWGLDPTTQQPLDNTQSTLTGFWVLADMLTPR